MMHKIIVTKYGPPEVLEVRQFPIPDPSENEVLIRIHYAGINFSEIMARMKLYPGAPEPPCGIGSEASGEVVAVGTNVTRFKPGQHVMTFCRFGSYSTHCCVDENMVIQLPSNFTLKQGAAFPLVYITAYMMMFQLGNLKDGEVILIHGAGGGGGTAAIQLAMSVGAGMICTASKWKHEKLQKMGVHHCIDYRNEDVARRARHPPLRRQPRPGPHGPPPRPVPLPPPSAPPRTITVCVSPSISVYFQKNPSADAA